MQQIGPIQIIEGPHKSKVPYSRSLYIASSHEKVLIDTGADPHSLQQLNKQSGVDLVINTHYHPDHTCHNYLFPKAEKWINKIEYEMSLTVEGIAKANGVYQEWGSPGVKEWAKNIPQTWIQSLSEINGYYEYEKEYRLGDVNVIFLHTPGHTKGFNCPYFPDFGVVFTGDYDMTTFGPWYNGTDGNIDEFISSAQRLLSLDANTFITGHQKGTFQKDEFHAAMKKYLTIIDQRDNVIEKYVKQGLDFEELTSIGIFYPKNTLEHSILKTWERSGIRKHLHRLGYKVENGTIKHLVYSNKK
ncbi:MBL fold metallo-hydrolase [Metabacillus litoralis]|uniref:MBL fold metallo-hydrolase n=1 Tax=Metabacillus litoralis TaxID=152268 RepID=UPI00203F1A18|nr:MBL fold metallo-hydrolase [Metabacillus litoralis]